MSTPDFPWSERWPEISNERVREAFSQVSRSDFLDVGQKRWADQDAPLPIGEDQTISQPFVVALMIQAADPQPGERVLEIGTGSGFQTALLCEMTREDSVEDGNQDSSTDADRVYSTERYESLARKASERLERSGYSPSVYLGDGAEGLPQHAPYDAIVVSAAAPCVPAPLWEQLNEGGRLVIPVGGQYDEQMLWLLIKVGGQMHRQQLGKVRFVPLISPLLEDPANCLPFDEKSQR